MRNTYNILKHFKADLKGKLLFAMLKQRVSETEVESLHLISTPNSKTSI